MNWENKFSKNGAEIQVDTKGNILQMGGGVIPKACQNCGKEFFSNVVQDELKQTIRSFKCKECDFTSLVSDEAIVHSIKNEDHKLDIKEEDKVVGYKKTLDGVIPVITKTEDDVLILCRGCNDVD